MVTLATGDTRVSDFPDANRTVFPYWFVLHRGMQQQKNEADLVYQTWLFGVVYALAWATAGYDGKYSRQMDAHLPKVINYFNEHPRLTWPQTGTIPAQTTPVRYWTAITPDPTITNSAVFGVVQATGIIGFEVQVSATFAVPIPTQW
jgi:ammonia channel protein AmtB